MFNEGIHISENKLALGWLKLLIWILTWTLYCSEFYFKKQLISEKRKLNTVGEELKEKSVLSGFFLNFLSSQWSAQICPILQSIWILWKEHVPIK